MDDRTVPADAHIDHSAALSYWNSIPATVNGMLGGFPQISRIDLQGSANFLAKLRRLSPSSTPQLPLPRAVDCGAGIGRITLGFLHKACRVVDIVEPVEKFTRQIAEGDAFQPLREAGSLGEVVNQGLEHWTPAREYDLIWNQWCVGHLTDSQLAAYLERCGAALTEGGWVVVKENISTNVNGDDVFDELDSSVTRTDASFKAIFDAAHMKVVKTELQPGFPKTLYPVRFYALQPKRP
ncbi:MAG: hypothetical protein M1819_003406 [Sarea resinae]|nr:MAG: hypothetical protein M1819_003406 [Sarea resinae]